MSFLQVRVDEDLKKKASELYDSLGLDLSSAIRIFLYASLRAGGFPFDVRDERYDVNFWYSIARMQYTSEKNGNSEMTLDEINEIIKEVREERRKKKEL